MLYFLRSANSEKTFYLVNKNEFIVGRKDCDVLLEGDSSISRKHAKIRIKRSDQNESVTIEDTGSKYKTLHNDQELPHNVEVNLENGDKIQFGALSSIFKFQQEKIVVSSTLLTSEQKTTLHKQLNFMGGQYSNDWSDDCTHLTLEKITLTRKILHALIDEKPMVIPSFWSKHISNIKKNLPPPNINDYNNPPMGEILVNEMEFQNAAPRKNLFKSLTFLFYLEQEMQKLEALITKAGGTAISWQKSRMSVADIKRSSQTFLVMETDGDAHDDEEYESVVDYFAKQNMRTIPIPEVVLAILRGSCRKECNPLFNRAKEVFQASTVQNPGQTLVENTETQDFLLSENRRSTTDRIVLETLEDETNVPAIKKKKTGNSSRTINPCDSQHNKLAIVEIEDEPDAAPQRPRKEAISFQQIVIEDEDNHKRAANDEGNPFCKRARLEKPSTAKSRFQITQKYGNSTNDNQSESHSDSKSQKRKAEEVINLFSDCGVSKKGRTEKKTTPESSPAPKNTRGSLSNPKNQQTINILQDVSVSSRPDQEINDAPIFTSTRNETLSFPELSIENMNRSGWISKATISNNEVTEKEQLNEEMQRFVDLFKNKVVVEVVSGLVNRPRDTTCEINSTDTSTKKNFKRFKKVQPLHPQRRIIGRDSLEVVTLGYKSNENKSEPSSSCDSDPESPPPAKPESRRKLRTFEIE